MYYEASADYTGTAACMASQFILPNITCVNFKYHMYGSDMGTLNVYRYDGQHTLIRSVTGDQGNVWKTVEMNFPSGGQSLVIQAIRGNGYRSDIAIDDVSTTDGVCHPPGE